MKLRNKNTGEILDVYKGQVLVHFNGGKETRQFKSLSQFKEEWEDYEDPNEYYYLDSDGDILRDHYDGCGFDRNCQSIGNFFETKEEAERVVKKLKAWKRLKDAGFQFGGWSGGGQMIKFKIPDADNMWKEIEDLDLLFGDEE